MALRSGRVGIHPSQVDPITGMLLGGPTPGSVSFEDLADAQISNPEAGQTLIFNGTGWENEFSSISSTTLAALQDVAISSVSNDQILRYDSTSEKWKNEDMPAIPAAQVNSDWNADSGVARILNKPSIPTNVSDLTNGYVWTSGISALAGATTATITDANITANSTIEVFASVQGIQEPTLTVSSGSCVLTFPALAQNTTFKLRISN